MSPLQSILFSAVSLFASIIGAVCGIGGGVIIKPVLDAFGWASVSTISFLSSCTVLAMSSYSVTKSIGTGDRLVRLKTGTPLAIGAAIGGIVGKQLFTGIAAFFPDPDQVGAVQALCLAIITCGTLIYSLRKDKIHTYTVTSAPICILIGMALGICSSFLGIGGGPINLVVLYFFFSMDTKTAAANSLYIILFSQISSLIVTLLGGDVPDFTPFTLVVMVSGGILGGMLGRVWNRRLTNERVDQLFIILMICIVGICIYNIVHYAG